MYKFSRNQALSISALALKNRQNPTSSQRILLFVGSKISESVEQLKHIGRKLGKNNITLTIFAFGDLSPEQREKIEGLASASSETQNRTVWVEKDRNLTDVMISSSVFDASAAAAAAAANPVGMADAGFGDINDPELMAALRASLEQHQKEEAERLKTVDPVPVEGAMKEHKGDQAENKAAEIERENAQELEAEKLAQQLNERQAQRDAQAKKNAADHQDNDKLKKDKAMDAETIASEHIAQSEIPKGQQRPIDFLTEKGGGTVRTRTEAFKNEFERLAEDEEQELDEQKKKEKEKEKPKGNYTEKYQSKRHEENDK